MAIVVGVNSWVTLVEADAYLTTKAGAAEWFALADSAAPGEDSKETFLVSAYYWLLYDSGFGLVPENTDNYVKIAQIEAALFLLNYRVDYENRAAKIAGGVERFKNSKWEEDLGVVSKPSSVLDPLEKGGYSGANEVAQLCGEDYS